jgi:hypothetical protein
VYTRGRESRDDDDGGGNNEATHDDPLEVRRMRRRSTIGQERPGREPVMRPERSVK